MDKKAQMLKDAAEADEIVRGLFTQLAAATAGRNGVFMLALVALYSKTRMSLLALDIPPTVLLGLNTDASSVAQQIKEATNGQA